VKRGSFLEHVGWTGAAGIAYALGSDGLFAPAAAAATPGALSFVQISDSHIGFNRPANDHVEQTLADCVRRINALPQQPAFVMHTGDVTHLSKPAQFDTAKQILSQLKAPLFTLPGEHDVIGDGGAAYRAVFGRADAPNGWYAFDRDGVHVVALVNVSPGEAFGALGGAQLDWLRADLASRPPSTPIVVFGHVPLYTVYAEWGWTTNDGGEALALLKRFDSVSVFNGHIHQVLTHREGNIRFATAASTAYPQPAPGTAPQPGPLTLPPDHLLHAIGYRTVQLDAGSAGVTDVPLG
jgi:3',5'-cyclic AMP phosphodiesterase CpdA